MTFAQIRNLMGEKYAETDIVDEVFKLGHENIDTWDGAPNRLGNDDRITVVHKSGAT
jgi:hypothetical protein